MNAPWVVLEKKVGETPLSVIERWREEQGLSSSIPLSYAGRLDPMASGKLLVLIGEECKKQTDYTGLDKEYVVEVLLGFSTDTGDILGLPSARTVEVEINEEKILQILQKEEGSHTREYPLFSSKTVDGKPLFLYALEKTVDTITIPTHTERIYTIQRENVHTVNKEALASHIASLLSLVPRTNEESKRLGADFRQDEIRQEWKRVFEKNKIQTFSVLTIRVTCASGTYMRTLAQRIGRSLGTDAIALSIQRTAIGEYDPQKKEWVRSF